ncbi:hypothetical protein [Solidesulfovibrio fructosivorans]|uniref:hypothetical protein n=1 Tax=Solidesulfovibrio fructosivorans TaxID=878 RepID=UPI0011815A21|nr:hypothetical protein [Solidesulfovibrio fructosivorans]
MDPILEKSDLAKVFKTTVKAIENHLSRKNYDIIPAPIRLGRRPVWLESQVQEFFNAKLTAQQALTPPSLSQKKKRGRPRKTV